MITELRERVTTISIDFFNFLNTESAINLKPVTHEELKSVRLRTRGVSRTLNFRLARRLKHEILNASYTDIDHLGYKIKVLAHFYFTKSNLDALRDLGDLAKAKIPKSYWAQTYHKYLIMMLQFEEALSFAESNIDHDISPDPFLRLYIESLLLLGKPDDAIEFAVDTLNAHWERLDGQGRQRIFELLVQSGQADRFTEVREGTPNQNQTLEIAAQLAKGEKPTVPIICISLDRDFRRLQTTRKFMPESCKFVHSRAVSGAAIPRAVLEFGNIPHKNRTDSEIGCSLSHIKAWETVATICDDDEYALVLEDDARFIFGPGAGLHDVLEAAKNEKAGIVFINKRSSEKIPEPDDPSKFRLIHLSKIFTEYRNNSLRQGPGWGADGYLINGKTAKYLADIWLEIGLAGALDWQLFLLGQKDLQNIPVAPKFSGAIEGLHAARATGKDPYYFDGFVSELSITTAEDYGYSTINSGNF